MKSEEMRKKVAKSENEKKERKKERSTETKK